MCGGQAASFNPRSRVERPTRWSGSALMRFLQSTLPRGERLKPVSYVAAQRRFNPRSRVGSDVYNICEDKKCTELQSTLPRGERLGYRAFFGVRYLLQSTLPRGERHNLILTQLANCWLQSTLPRGERISLRSEDIRKALLQSTLPRGERLLSLAYCNYLLQTSIHAPAWGATTGSDSTTNAIGNFNPRSRVGSDAGAATCPGADATSIHAPAWGATAKITIETISFGVIFIIDYLLTPQFQSNKTIWNCENLYFTWK